jgi:peptide/nickel transport system permease protein
MSKYIIKRLLWMIVVVLGVAFIIFTLLYFTPGDPARIMLGDTATQAEVDALRAKLGIDQPYMVQLLRFLKQTFIDFDFGDSWTYKKPITDEIVARLPRTVGMGLANMILTTIIGIPLGVFAAYHQGKWQDYGMIGLCMVLVSLPGFWVSLMCILIFSLRLGWFPSHGIGGIQYYVLPVLSGIFGGVAGLARQTRSAVLEVIRSDFITTARAKGQSERNITMKHLLPNALMPVVTMLGGTFTMVVAGSAITENLFSIPGIGLYLLNGIEYRDYPIVRGCTLLLAIYSSIVMLLVDLVYAWMDPRIKAQYSGKNEGKMR